jgi:predicted RNA methylase
MNTLFKDKNSLFDSESSFGEVDRYSFAGTDTGNEKIFVNQIKSDLQSGISHDKRKVLKIASNAGLQDETQIKELYETAVMLYLKSIYTKSVSDNYKKTVEIYHRQMSLNTRTSNSVMLQQYSTAAPIAYLAGAYVAHNQANAQYFEPSAGNGLLTLALIEKQTTVNEIDRNRRHNLENFHDYLKVTNEDASKPFSYSFCFNGIITNPPFGKTETRKFGGYKISKLEHAMAIHALDTMSAAGRAAIIIGGHTEWNQYGQVERGANLYFLSYLHHFYNVEDTINIDGKLYSKQGTTVPIRLILINGRKSIPEGTAPLKTEYDRTVKSFDELFERIKPLLSLKPLKSLKSLKSLKELEKEMEKAIAQMEREMGLSGFYKQ